MYSSPPFLRSIEVDDPPPLIVENFDLSRNARKFPRSAFIAHSPQVDAAAKPCGIEHNLADHLENFTFEDMRADRGIGAALDLLPIVVVFRTLTSAAVGGLMIDNYLPRALNFCVVTKGG
jgi:hypothetical protein